MELSECMFFHHFLGGGFDLCHSFFNLLGEKFVKSPELGTYL